MSSPEVERAAARMRSRAPRNVEGPNGRPIMILRPSIELHLPPNPLTPTERRRIKQLGGEASECRGHSDTRFVHMPLTAAGLQLAEELLARHQWLNGKRHTIIFRRVPRLDDFLTRAHTMAAARDAFLAFARREHRAGNMPRPLTAEQRYARRVRGLLDQRNNLLRALRENGIELGSLGITPPGDAHG